MLRNTFVFWRQTVCIIYTCMFMMLSARWQWIDSNILLVLNLLNKLKFIELFSCLFHDFIAWNGSICSHSRWMIKKMCFDLGRFRNLHQIWWDKILRWWDEIGIGRGVQSEKCAVVCDIWVYHIAARDVYIYKCTSLGVLKHHSLVMISKVWKNFLLMLCFILYRRQIQ